MAQERRRRGRWKWEQVSGAARRRLVMVRSRFTVESSGLLLAGSCRSQFSSASLFDDGFSRLHTSNSQQWPSQGNFGPAASHHWHSPALSVSPQCTRPIQLAGVIGLAGRAIICNLNTVTGPHIFFLCSHFPPHCSRLLWLCQCRRSLPCNSAAVFLFFGGG